MIDTNTVLDNKYQFKNITKEQAKDTGMAIVLILFILGQFFPDSAGTFHISAIIVLIINMVVPIVYKPAAWLWFGFSHILGTVMSKILLTVIFIFLVTPVGIIRNLMGKDTLLLKKWKKDDSSVFHVRDHLFQSQDVEKPY
jgi:hypothetical protein